MTDLHDQRPLSRVELMVLARLSAAKAPTQSDIAKSLAQSGLPLTGTALTDCVIATLATLQHRALATAAATGKRTSTKTRTPPKTSAAPRFALTDSGRSALRDAFGLDATPTWTHTCNSVVPAIVLGVEPDSKSAGAALASTEAMTATLLRRDRALGEPRTVNQLCDQLIARALGMPPGTVTPAAIRAYALAMHCGVDSKSEFTEIATKFAPTRGARSTKLDGEIKVLANRFARAQLHSSFTTKTSLVKTLQKHWLTQQDEADEAHRQRSWSTPLRPSQSAAVDAFALEAAPTTPPLSTLQTAAGDPLLAAVRAAIPMIGSTGRYGKENVFVSALWQHLASDRRVLDISLDRFKRWLVAANRDQLLDLARADLIDDMDARLVEDSKIEDLGATFHFVVDRREIASAQVQAGHAR